MAHIPRTRLSWTWLSRSGHFLGSSLQVLTTFPEGAMLEWVPASRKAIFRITVDMALFQSI